MKAHKLWQNLPKFPIISQNFPKFKSFPKYNFWYFWQIRTLLLIQGDRERDCYKWWGAQKLGLIARPENLIPNVQLPLTTIRMISIVITMIVIIDHWSTLMVNHFHHYHHHLHTPIINCVQAIAVFWTNCADCRFAPLLVLRLRLFCNLDI